MRAVNPHLMEIIAAWNLINFELDKRYIASEYAPNFDLLLTKRSKYVLNQPILLASG